MRAAVLHQPGDIRLEMRPAPRCPEHGVSLQITACGVCAADIKMAQHGHRALVMPRILGHEIVARIAESRHAGHTPGQRVVLAPGLGCGTCRWCRMGKAHRCGSVSIFGFSRDGGFCEKMVVPLVGPCAASLLSIPDGVSDTLAALTEPLACCINAQHSLDIAAEDAVLIVGGGPLGLLHTLLAAERSPRTILISDPSPARRELAAQFPVHGVLDPSATAWQEALRRHTGGYGIDVLILATSAVSLGPQFTEILNRGARVSLFSGMPASTGDREFDWNRVHYHEWRIAGAYGCSADHCRMALRTLERRVAAFEPIISGSCDLAALPAVLLSPRLETELKTILKVN